MLLKDDTVYEAELNVDDDGIWTAQIWYLSEDGRKLLAVYVDVECPAVGDTFRATN